MQENVKTWSRNQKVFRETLLAYNRHAQAIQMFLQQHGQLHSAAIEAGQAWSYEDELLDDLDEAAWRRIPEGGEHSIAWLVWHLARIEDAAMNVLVADSQQVWAAGGWAGRLNAPYAHTGNVMPSEDVARLSAGIDMQALRAYRQAVGRRTQEIAAGLGVEDCKQGVHPKRIQRLRDEGAVLPEAEDLLTYWSRRTISGLLLMPPTRHNLVHLNEVARVKRKSKG